MNKYPQRKAHRLIKYDYAQEGLYFVTICIDPSMCRGGSRTARDNDIFGNIHNGTMVLNDIGHMINQYWQWLEKQYAYIELDEYVIMPDHLHGIMCMEKNDNESGGSRTAPTDYCRKTLGRLIGAFKTISSKNIRRDVLPQFKWQRSFYDHIIRDENDLELPVIKLNKAQKYLVKNLLIIMAIRLPNFN